MLESGLSSARGMGCCSHRFPRTCVGAGPRLPPPGGPGAPTACTGAQKRHCAYIRRWPPREDNGQAGLRAEPAAPHGGNAPAGAPRCPQEVTERWARLPLRGLSLHSRRDLGAALQGPFPAPTPSCVTRAAPPLDISIAGRQSRPGVQEDPAQPSACPPAVCRRAPLPPAHVCPGSPHAACSDGCPVSRG